MDAAEDEQVPCIQGTRDSDFPPPSSKQPSQLLHSRKKVRTLSECGDNNSNPQSRPMSRSHSRNSSLGMMSSHSSFDMLDQIRYVPQQVQDDSNVSYFKSITMPRTHLTNRITSSPDFTGPEIQVIIPAPSTNPYLEDNTYVNGTRQPHSPTASSSSSSSSSKDSRISPTSETKGYVTRILRNLSGERDHPTLQHQHARNRMIWISPYKERPRYMMDFEEEGIIGSGNFSNVYKARGRLDGCLYAIKKMKTKVTDTVSNGFREVHALSALQGCKHLLRYHSCWVEDQHLWIQTELCLSHSLDVFIMGVQSYSQRNSPSFGFADVDPTSSGRVPTPTGVLRNITASGDFISLERKGISSSIKRSDGFEGILENLAWVIMEQISEALSFLHTKGVVHLDIRPANIFITSSSSRTLMSEFLQVESGYIDETLNNLSKGLIQGTLMLKVGDFGFCCQVDNLSAASEGEARYCSREMISGLEASMQSVSLASTLGLKAALTAPIDNSNNDSDGVKIDLTKADIFSLGASVYELCKGNPLAADGSTTEDGSSEWHDIRNGQLNSEIMSEYSPEFNSFLKSMMDPNPLARPSADEIYEHCKQHKKSIEAGIVLVETRKESLQDLKTLLSKLNVRMESDIIQQVTDILRQNIV